MSKKPKLYNMHGMSSRGFYGVRIDRGTPYGNPFIMDVDGDRDEVCNLFAQYALWRLSVQPNWLDQLKGKDLYCWCVPERCHGETLLSLIKDKENKAEHWSQLDRLKGVEENKKEMKRLVKNPKEIGNELVKKGFLREVTTVKKHTI